MLHPRVIVMSASLLAAAIAPSLAAQRVEVAVRIGHSAPTGTQFQLTNSIEAVRVWDNGGLSVGFSASYWVSGHFGVQGTADLQFTRHQGSWVYSGPCCIPMEPGPGTMDANATNLLASLRLALRQGLGGRLQLGVSLGPALIRFGDAEQSQAPDYALAHRTTYGVAAGLSAACALSSRFRFSVGTDYVAFRVQPAAPSFTMLQWSWTAVAPMQHQFTVSAMAAVTVS